jgi:hypothetical protein
MGISLRIFIVEDDDTIHRLPLAKYERLLKRNSKECLPQYAGKRVRYALVVVDLHNRKPMQILRFQYSFLTFDAEGRFDPADREEETRLAFDIMPPIPISFEKDPDNVIEARHLFAEKRFKHKYTWTPSPEMESVIVNEIFGNS